MAGEQNGKFELPKLSVGQLINFVVGIIGIQFAWSMQIALSSRVLEPLGADPFLFGLIWCAGPITGILVQPIVGALSDRTWTKIGRRRPFLLVGAVLGSISLLFFPFAPTLLIAALMIWIIDACVNISQGPYRALVPDAIHEDQHAVANSYMNAAFGVGSVVALGAAPLLHFFHISMSVEQQYIMASLALLLTIIYTSLTIKEFKKRPQSTEKTEASDSEPEKKDSMLESFKVFFTCSKEIHKICAVQFLIWMGIMCMFIYLTQYTVHYIYKLPDMSTEEYKSIKENHTLFNETYDLVKIKNAQKLLDANKKLNEILTNINENTFVFPVITETTDLASFTTQQKDNLRYELEKYSLLNESADNIIRTLTPNYNEYKKEGIKKLETIINNLEETKIITAKTTKLKSNFADELKKLVKLKTLTEYKILLIQFPLLKNEIIRKKVDYLTDNQALLESVDTYYNENGSITDVAEKNKIFQEKKQTTNEKKFNKDLESITSIHTYPSVMIKFYENYRLDRFHNLELDGALTSELALVAFNLMPLLLSIPFGYLCNKIGKKLIFSISLAFLAVSFAFAPIISTSHGVILMMAAAGVAWATILSIPFAFLCDYMPPGNEGVIMGIFNMFIAGPQLISATIIGAVIRDNPITTALGQTHNWSIAFVVASVSVFCAIAVLQFVKEKNRGIACTVAGGGH